MIMVRNLAIFKKWWFDDFRKHSNRAMIPNGFGQNGEKYEGRKSRNPSFLTYPGLGRSKRKKEDGYEKGSFTFTIRGIRRYSPDRLPGLCTRATAFGRGLRPGTAAGTRGGCRSGDSLSRGGLAWRLLGLGSRRVLLEPRLLGASPSSGRGLGAGSLAPLPAGLCLAPGALAIRFSGEAAKLPLRRNGRPPGAGPDPLPGQIPGRG